ncbi:hypothetical protein SERLA73DRAFT_192123 [Serpula lacrymans var. lacrymans S7.3]|uniref:DUF6533 domain-containing protein n=2 Tax=Serpula lacrymans var. lacrymans TaxID=341189 RepID=F8QJ16_SERL3|nr:uncharacterized protein SERLADRAFT_469996 [Serpula lacrymans var. lacrymans S7.9]EGN91710.1 hypothetical protein SERLA73DRAFT_192123 [Serpula lacrymans var. lacrymans S7.3]EGO23732.1 hypothetical protein SERLADRAFT_469996 [Serpula lacrymans var. lacrymans S7.9]
MVMSTLAWTTTSLADYQDVYSTNYVGLAGFTLLVWDHLITFADEVEFIWQGRKGALVYLFLLNRYMTPLGFIVNLVAYLSTWPQNRCTHFVRYEGAMTLLGIQIVALMMLLRVYAMYPDNKSLVGLLVLIFLAWTGVNALLLAKASSVLHEGLSSCTMVFDPGMPFHIASSSAWFPLMFDTVVFVSTMYRAIPSIRHKEAGRILRTMLNDGLLYYSVICGVNLVLTVMIVRAPPGIQNITAQLELLLTVAMMSRITLNLKKQAAQEIFSSTGSVVYPVSFARSRSGSEGSIRPPSVVMFHPQAGSSSSAKARGSAIRFSEPLDQNPRAGPRLNTKFSESDTGLTPELEEVGFSWEVRGSYEMKATGRNKGSGVETQS